MSSKTWKVHYNSQYSQEMTNYPDPKICSKNKVNFAAERIKIEERRIRQILLSKVNEIKW